MEGNRKIIRVLLVDDDEEDYLITKDIIEEIHRKHYQIDRSYKIDWADSYDSALKQIFESEHDVYLVDYRLGAYDGLQLIGEAFNWGFRGPFILLTGQSDLETDERAMKAGAVDFLVKGSFSPFELDRTIRYSIEHHKNLTEISALNIELEKRVNDRTAQLKATVQKLESTNSDLQNQIRVRKIAEEALRESQNIYSAIAYNFPNGTIAVLNRNLEYVLVDGRELKELGLETRDLINRRFDEVFEEANMRGIARDSLNKVLEGHSLSFEVTFRERDYLLHATPLLGPVNDEIYQILVVSENITERKKAEMEIRRALEKERELNELKSRFVTMASHEFRTPLSTILSSAALLARYEQTADHDKRLKHVERIRSNVNHLNRLLNDFLSLGKLEEGKIINNPAENDLIVLARNVVEEIQLMANKGQNIQFEVSGAPRKVLVDEQLMKNILNNLLSNAIKYSPSGKDVFLSIGFTSTRVTIAVRDQGIGIPEEEQVHLFERFFRAKNTTNIQGTGLGLNIVRKYVELMEGSIEFSSKLNEGTTFTINFNNL